MTRKILKLDKGDIKQISEEVFFAEKDTKQSLFIYNLVVKDRDEGIRELQALDFPDEVYTYMRDPSESIRFQYVDNTLYGELAYFSMHTHKSNYASIVIEGNTLYVTHKEDVDILSWISRALSSLNKQQRSRLDCDFILYLLVLELLSRKGKLMIAVREKVENLAIELDRSQTDISSGDFLDAKTQISDFSRVLEKLVFTITFPPAIDIVDPDSSYHAYFKELGKNLDLLKSSVTQTEERLNSLHDHFELLLQEKSNRRLNLLTIVQAIFAPLTLLAGIYGMNFRNMPELNLKYGYFIALGVMGIITLILVRFFFKRGWFD